MSFQPQGQFAYQPPPPVATPKGKRRKGLIVVGLILLLGGLVGGGAIVGKGMSNYKEAVKSLARAPVGCTTTLVFDKPATFTLYAETKGKIGDLSGDCEANGSDYNHAGDKLPKIALTLTDPNGDSVDLQRGATAKYDVDGYVGTGVRTVQIQAAGTYHLNVESDESDFAVSIGKNPKKDSDQLLAIGGGVALGGLVIGLLLFLLGLRRRRPEPAVVGVGYPAAPMPGWPPSPHAGVPPNAPPTPPQYQGFRPEPPQAPQPIGVPGRPPIRLGEQAPGTGFAPPTFAPPTPADRPAGGYPTSPPTAAAPSPPTGPPTAPRPAATQPNPEPPVASPPSATSGTGWAVPEHPKGDEKADD